MKVCMKDILRKIPKWGLMAYVAYAAFIGTQSLISDYTVMIHNHNTPAPMPVYLSNGFIYDDAPGPSWGGSSAIYDKNENVVIIADVRNVMWHEDTIYGFRLGLAGEPYYYVCTYGEDCSGTQHLTEMEFIRMVKERGLPAYDSHVAQTYYQLLQEQSKTDIGQYGG